jgi:hypothetical protein
MSSKTIFAILFAIFCFDLTAHSWSLIWDVPKSILNQPIQDKILTHLGTMQPELEHGAAFRFTALAARPDQAINHEPKGVKLSPAGQHGQSILYRGLSSTGILYGLSDIAGNGAAGNRTRSDLFKAIGDADPKRLLDLTSVRYFSVLDESDLTHVSVKMNLESLPFLYFPKRLIFSEVGGVGARELLDSNFYPKDEIYVELGSKSTEVNGSYTSPRIVTQSNDRIEIEVTPLKRDQGDVLVINQSYDRWWKARIGKTPLNILRVNGWAMGVDLARQCPVAGCVVVVEYDNLLITAGTWVTLLFLCFLLWCIFKMRKSIDG